MSVKLASVDELVEAADRLPHTGVEALKNARENAIMLGLTSTEGHRIICEAIRIIETRDRE